MNLWVELVGSFIIARVRGVPTEPLIRECQERVVALLEDTECRKILYDALEMDNPTLDIALVQQELSTQFGRHRDLKVALVVPNTRTAYLARVAFGEADHRVFYNDIGAAVEWLNSAPQPAAPEPPLPESGDR